MEVNSIPIGHSTGYAVFSIGCLREDCFPFYGVFAFAFLQKATVKTSLANRPIAPAPGPGSSHLAASQTGGAVVTKVPTG